MVSVLAVIAMIENAPLLKCVNYDVKIDQND